MKKHTTGFIAALIAISMYSCSPGSGTTTPATPTTPTVTPTPPTGTGSTFNITFAGHTYNLLHNPNPPATVITAGTQTNNNLTPPIFGVAVVASEAIKLHFSITGQKADLSTATGVYKLLSITLTDYGDGGKVYSADTLSTITVTTSNSTEVKGTFNLNLTYNGTTYPATGDFHYKK